MNSFEEYISHNHVNGEDGCLEALMLPVFILFLACFEGKYTSDGSAQ